MPRRHLVLLTPIGLSLALAACGSSGVVTTATSVARLAHWMPMSHIRRFVDLTDPRTDGAIVVAAAGRLQLRGSAGALRPYAAGDSGYTSPGGEEAYIALPPPSRARGVGCTFGASSVYALRLVKGPGVTVVDSRGRARRFASIPGPGLETGIAFDHTGRFGHRLLVTVTAGSRTTLWAIDCRGGARSITRSAPRIEGGIAVAPATFGRYAGDLVGADENSGHVYAIAPGGSSHLIADSGLPRGGDIGVESAGFLPAGFGGGWSALVADRLTPGNAHPGNDVILSISARALSAAGVGPGDLLVAGEGGAHTDAISCASSCSVRHVADGPALAHLEGHIVFTANG